MKIAFYGGKQAGMIVLLTLLSLKHEIKFVFAEDEIIERTAQNFNIPLIHKSLINDEKTINKLKAEQIELFICCHGKKILKEDILKLKCINLHPCLYRYKGSDPVERLIKDQNTRASVAVHWMVPEVDAGEVIIELFKEVELNIATDVYNQLYPLYSDAIIKALKEF